MTYPSPSEVERIAQLSDPVLRNLQITQAYFEVSSAILERIPGGANWCTYAVWASKQAGQTIRQEDLTDTARRVIQESGLIRDEVERVLPILTFGLPDAYDLVARVIEERGVFESTARTIALGNLQVYEEIGYHCSRFIEFLDSNPEPDSAAFAGFLAPLRPGPSPDGQRLLREAFSSYDCARRAEQSKLRAELLLLGSLKIGVHEQLRLQPRILEALRLPILDREEFIQRLSEALQSKTGLLQRILLWLLPSRRQLVREVATLIADRVDQLIRRVVTRRLTVLELPGNEVLRLGEDLTRDFPELLRHLDHPECIEFLRSVDPTPDSPVASGALDWATYAERIHYIADFFRAYQQHSPLQADPFTPGQVADIKAGRRPAGQL